MKTVTVTIRREFRLDPSDPTIVQTRDNESLPWRPFAACLDEGDAFHVACCCKLREARCGDPVVVNLSTPEDMASEVIRHLSTLTRQAVAR